MLGLIEKYGECFKLKKLITEKDTKWGNSTLAHASQSLLSPRGAPVALGRGCPRGRDGLAGVKASKSWMDHLQVRRTGCGDKGQEQVGDGVRDQALASGERRPQLVVVVMAAALEIAGGLYSLDCMPSAPILLWN